MSATGLAVNGAVVGSAASALGAYLRCLRPEGAAAVGIGGARTQGKQANRGCPSLRILGIERTAQSHPPERGTDCLDADQTATVPRSPAAFPLSRDTPRSSRSGRLPALADTVNQFPAVRNRLGIASFRV